MCHDLEIIDMGLLSRTHPEQMRIHETHDYRLACLVSCFCITATYQINPELHYICFTKMSNSCQTGVCVVHVV